MSEKQLQSELNDTRRNRAAGDLSEIAARTASIIVKGRIELRVVPNIVELCTEFRIQRFRDFRVLDQRNIPVVLAGARDNPNT